MPSRPTKKLNLPLPEDIHSALFDEAKREGVPATRLARAAIKAWLEHRGARTLVGFDFAIGYRDEKVSRETLIKALVPFYHSRTLSFVNKTLDLDMQGAELYLENINRVFEKEKGYLVERWDRTRKGSRGKTARG